MEKLELKHIVGYLLHGLKILVCGNECEMTIEDEMDSSTICLRDVIENKHKPILYPLSDYEKFNEIVLEMSNYEIIMIDNNPDLVKRLSYEVIELMFKNHIDIHGLIGKGLAININEIK
jgi:hypothetical protein